MTSKRASRAEAQAKAAEMRAAQERRDRQRKQMIVAVAAAVVVLVGFAVVLAISSSRKDDKATQAADFPAVVQRITTVPESAFETAGVPDEARRGGVPKKLPDGKVLMKDGKPRVVYVGGLFCPVCGMHRWSMVVALSRFGTWKGLAQHRSSESGIPTFTFEHATFSSKYLAFDPYEAKGDEGFQGPDLMPLPADVKAAESKYQPDGPSYPWIFYGTHEESGAYGPSAEFQALDGDDAWDKISQEIASGSGEIGKSVDAQANVMTAQICQLTKGQPGNVCSSKPVVEASSLLQE